MVYLCFSQRYELLLTYPLSANKSNRFVVEKSLTLHKRFIDKNNLIQKWDIIN